MKCLQTGPGSLSSSLPQNKMAYGTQNRKAQIIQNPFSTKKRFKKKNDAFLVAEFLLYICGRILELQYLHQKHSKPRENVSRIKS